MPFNKRNRNCWPKSEGRAIRSSLESIPRLAKEDKQWIVEVDAIRLEVLKAIQDVLDL